MFSKKLNSTALPGGDHVTYNCRIKEPCGILAPVISLNLGLENNPAQYNYAYIPAFNRYYFIKEWTFENALWNATMQVDTMASWRGYIGGSSCYILRCSNTFEGKILDNSYPGISMTSLQDSQTSSPWITDNMDNGTYVVGVAGQKTTYYMFMAGGLDLFFQYLFSNNYANAVTGGAWADIYPQLKAQCNPLQYITSIMWFPFAATGTEVDTIRVGWVDVPAAAWRVDGSGLRNGLSGWTIRRHPQADRGEYLNNAPYSGYTLFYPPFGSINLDPDCMANSVNIIAEWNIDLRTGQGTMIVACGDEMEGNTHVMSWVHSQIGVHYQVSQVVNRGYGIGNTIMPAISAAANIATENYAQAGVAVLGEFGNFAASKIPSATTVGSMGGMDTLRGLPALQYEFKLVAEEDNAHKGRPLCNMRRIDTIPGYIKVANAYIDIPATQDERNAIISYMEGGFYYE